MSLQLSIALQRLTGAAVRHADAKDAFATSADSFSERALTLAHDELDSAAAAYRNAKRDVEALERRLAQRTASAPLPAISRTPAITLPDADQ